MPKKKFKAAILVYNNCVFDARLIKTAEAMAKRGFDARVFARNNGKQPVYEHINGVTYLREKVKRKPILIQKSATIFDKNKGPGCGIDLLDRFIETFSMAVIWLLFTSSLYEKNKEKTLKKSLKVLSKTPDANSFVNSIFGRLDIKKMVKKSADKVIEYQKKLKNLQKTNLSQKLVLRLLNLSLRFGVISRYAKSISMMAADEHFYRSLLDYEPDIIQANDFWPLPVAVKVGKELDIPVIYDVHEFESGRQDNSFSLTTNQDILEIELQNSLHIGAALTFSPRLAEYYKDSCGFMPHTIYNTPRAKVSFHDSHGVREDIGATHDDLICVYTGIAAKERGIEKFIKELSYFPDVWFVCVGPHTKVNKKYFNDIAVQFGVDGRFAVVDSVPFDDVSSYISSADFGVIPAVENLSNQVAGLPNKLFEMIFAGLPILCADIEQRRSATEEFGTGVFFPNKRDVQLEPYIRQMIDLVSAPGGRVRNQQLAELAFQSIGWDFQMDTLEKLYHDLIKSD